MPIILAIILVIGAFIIGTANQPISQTEKPIPTTIQEEVTVTPFPTPTPTPTYSIELIEKQQIRNYLYKIKPYIKEFNIFHQRILKLPEIVKNESYTRIAVEAESISKGFAEISRDVSTIKPPNEAINTHKKFKRVIDRFGLSTAGLFLLTSDFTSGKYTKEYIEMEIDIIYEDLKLAYSEKQSALEEFELLEREVKN